MRPINVLAVDDTPGNLTALEAVLGSECNLVRAVSGPQAIDILTSRHDIDVILMDIQMPKMDGFETVSHIKEMDAARDIPVVFMTAVYQDDPWVQKGYEVGAVDYISKPFNPDLLKLKVGLYASFKQKADFLKERELQLRISEELLAAARNLSSTLEQVPAGVIIVGAEGRLLHANDEAFRVWGSACSPGMSNGADAWVGTELLLNEQLAEFYRVAKGTQSVYRELVHIRCLDGSQKTVLCSASSLRDQAGSTSGTVLVTYDMTQSGKIKGEFEKRITDLVSADSEFAP